MFIGYFPQEWIVFLSIGAICAAFLGVIFGIRCDIKSFKALVILLTVIFSLVISSIAFDFHYLHKFSDNGETYEKPIYGCSNLQRYLETIPDFRNPSPSEWKNHIEQPECRFGAITTIIVSSAFAWSSIFVLFAFFYTVSRFGLNEFLTVFHLHNKQSQNTQNTDIQLSITGVTQDIILSEYAAASLDDDANKLVNCICHHISASNTGQLDGWDGHVFRDFIFDDLTSEQEKSFKTGFKDGENSEKVGIKWNAFQGLKGRGISKKTAIKIFEWKAMCTNTSLRKLLGKFVVYYEKKGRNPEFFKDVAPIAEKIKSEL